jgi:hypothetical protein
MQERRSKWAKPYSNYWRSCAPNKSLSPNDIWICKREFQKYYDVPNECELRLIMSKTRHPQSVKVIYTPRKFFIHVVPGEYDDPMLKTKIYVDYDLAGFVNSAAKSSYKYMWFEVR